MAADWRMISLEQDGPLAILLKADHALSGAGLCYLGLRDLRKALEYFERAVAVNPNLPQIKQYIEEIKQLFRDQSL